MAFSVVVIFERRLSAGSAMFKRRLCSRFAAALVHMSRDVLSPQAILALALEKRPARWTRPPLRSSMAKS